MTSTPLFWYEYRQNNSGGSFSGAHNVFVQARDASEANYLAERSGLVYFDDTYDCDCCGARWSEQWRDAEGSVEIEHYGQVVADWRDPAQSFGRWTGLQSARVNYDGTIEYGIDASKKEINND